MSKISSGILLYHIKKGQLRFYLVHPGGPFWKNKDIGAWSIPKGEINGNEDLLENALKELKEETGIEIKGKGMELGSTRLKSGKTIFAFAFEYNKELPELKSNTFEIEWPPGSGKMKEFPEIDKGAFFEPEEAAIKINEAQIVFLERLQQALDL